LPFTLAALSPTLRYAEHAAPASLLAANAQRLATAIRAAKLNNPDLGIVVLPLGCFSGGAGVTDLAPAADWLAPLIAAATDCDVCIAGADRYGCAPGSAGTEAGFLIAPQRGLVRVQRALSDGGTHIETFDSAHGRIAVLIGGDLLHPEYARLAMFAGAEILLNPCAERADERAAARQFSRAARAWENHVVIASCGLSQSVDADGLPAAALAVRAHSAIWSHSAQLLVEGGDPALFATIDLASLRQRRLDPWIHFPAQLRTGLYAEVYARAARGESAGAGAPPAAPASPAAPAAHEAYDVLLMQTHQVFVGGPDSRDATIRDNLDRALALAVPFAMRPSTKLVVFPEFFLQGSDGPHPHDYWERCGIRIPGPETDRLAAYARQCNVYVCGAVLEYDPEWPLRYFNTSIIIAPSGEIVLRYRKLQCADLNGLLNVTTPGNVFTQYVERYGYDALIPVIDTPIGRLGTLICYDSNWPELWRALALQGAEVICNPTSEIHSNRRPYWYQAKRAHAAEARVYVASANAGSEQFRAGAPVTGMNRGHSALIDFNGELVACADGPGVVPLVGRVELGELRRARQRPPARHEGRFQAAAVADAYRQFPGFPLDCFLAQPMLEAAEGPALVRQQLERLVAHGVIRR
jgi:predicted amidohydrolase